MQLHQILLSLAETVADFSTPSGSNASGTIKVYFQPPESLAITYPCIVYRRDKIEAKHANDKTYSSMTRYQVTTIDQNPDSALPNSVLELPFCAHERAFAHDGLNHDVFSLYH
jgi:hypothetical protein